MRQTIKKTKEESVGKGKGSGECPLVQKNLENLLRRLMGQKGSSNLEMKKWKKLWIRNIQIRDIEEIRKEIEIMR